MKELDFHYDTTPELRAEPWDYWDVLREQHGAFLTNRDMAAPTWVFTRFDAIYEGLHDYGLFSSVAVQPDAEVGAHTWIPEELDPPEHGKYRQILTAAFAPGPIEALEPSIRAHCVSLIESFVADGEVEIYDQFPRRYPTFIFMELMGLPTERAEDLLDWVWDVLHVTNDEDPDFAIRGGATMKIRAFLHEIFEARRTDPRDDLMTKLVQGEIDGRPLTDDELGEYGFLLYMAGLDTVAGIMACMFKHLADNEEHRRFLIDNPSRIPLAVEELLRYYAIVTTSRVVTHNADFHGCPMKEGHRAMFSTLSANRDPDAFTDADQVILDRNPNRHIGFGAGPHRCLGSNLARLELQIAIEEWLARIPDYRVVDPDSIETHAGGVAGMDRLQLAWEKK